MPKGKAAPIILSGYVRQLIESERDKLENIADSEAVFHARFGIDLRKIPRYEETRVYVLLRVKAILLAANGFNNRAIADQLQITPHTIGKWRRDFAYLLSREDLPKQQIIQYFWYIQNPVDGVLSETQETKQV